MGKVYSPTMTLAQSLNVTSNKPLDTRTVVAQYSDLTNGTTFGGYEYEGMLVYVQDEQQFYVLSNIDQLTWDQISIPHLSDGDEGKLLTAVKQTIPSTEPDGEPTYRYVAEWVDAPSGLPTINGTSDANKILQVNAGGTGVAWVKAPEELPTIGTSDANKILQVDASGTGVKWVENTHPKELPPYAGTESGKVLTVSSDGTGTEWSTIDTELMNVVTTNALFTAATRGILKPGMKYRITDYIPAVNPDYIVKINGVTYNIAPMAPVAMFDIIVTASSESTLFEDVELVAKAGVTTPFDYTKYEAKYDLFGNTTSPDPKYYYITSNGMGVIYYMKDQYGNESSYDFENICYINTSIFTGPIHTFSGFKAGDLRQYGIIQNVRMKNSRETLPGILFDFSSHHANSTETIFDVELNNCSRIYITGASLRHAKFSNSNIVSIDIAYNNNMSYYPVFENLNICNNDYLKISGNGETLVPFNEFGGFYVNNLNILPSITEKTIILNNIATQMLSIFTQGLIDSDILNKMNITPEDIEWTFAVINGSEPATLMVLGQPRQMIGNTISLPIDMAVYDSILNASKNIRPFNIFDGTEWSLEIPHFQSTATSVYELGI